MPSVAKFKADAGISGSDKQVQKFLSLNGSILSCAIRLRTWMASNLVRKVASWKL